MTQLRQFQRVGSDFLQARKNALLCDDAGLGKSAQALSACDALGLSRVLCVGPAVAGVSWPEQLQQWSPTRKFVRVSRNTKSVSEPGFYFVTYDTLSRVDNRALLDLLSQPPKWDVLLPDEGQYLKSPGANRTQAVYGEGGIAQNAHRVWVLSGTLTPNHAGEAWTHLRALAPRILRGLDCLDEGPFQERFCTYTDTKYGRAIHGSRNMRELRLAVQPIVLRRRKEEVLTELPPMEFFTAPIEASRDVVEALLTTICNELRGGETPTEDLLKALTEGTAFATARRSLGLAKVRGCASWAIDRLEAGEPKVLVFAHHRSVIEGLVRELMDFSPVVYHGDTPEDRRRAAVHAFQNDPRCRVFVGQLTAAGTAITLTAAKTVLLAEFAGTPGINYQAASRAHRMGQRDGVQVYLATVPGTLDERLAQLAARRAAEIAELFG